MISIWQRFSLREKILVAIAGCGILVFSLFQFVFRPVQHYVANAKMAYETSVSDLKFMQESKLKLKNRGNSPRKTIGSSDLQKTATDRAVAAGLTIARRQPASKDGLIIWIDNAYAPKLFSWITDLTGTYNIALTRLILNKNDDGSVRVQVELKIKG